MDVPEFVMMVLKRLRAYDYESLYRGGAVRDLIMNRPGADWDMATSAQRMKSGRLHGLKSFSTEA